MKFLFLKKLFGFDNTAEMIVKKGTDFVNQSFYTDKQKAEHHEKFLNAFIDWFKSNIGQNLVRRSIAIGVVSAYLFFLTFGIIIFIFNPAWATMVFNFVEEMGLLVSIIIGFYFGHGLLRTYKDVKTGNSPKA